MKTISLIIGALVLLAAGIAIGVAVGPLHLFTSRQPKPYHPTSGKDAPITVAGGSMTVWSSSDFDSDDNKTLTVNKPGAKLDMIDTFRDFVDLASGISQDHVKPCPTDGSPWTLSIAPHKVTVGGTCGKPIVTITATPPAKFHDHERLKDGNTPLLNFPASLGYGRHHEEHSRIEPGGITLNGTPLSCVRGDCLVVIHYYVQLP